MKRGRGVAGQEIILSHRWKVNCNWYGTNMHVIPGNWLAVGGLSASFFFAFSVQMGEKWRTRWEREKKTFIFYWTRCCDALLNWCCSSLEDGESVPSKQKENGEGGRKGRLKDKKEKSEIWVKQKREKGWKGVWQVNLEQISIVTEQESRMWWAATGSG